MNSSENKQITVAVGISGGVDSSVAAYLLKQQGYRVFAIFMQNWESDNDDPHCTAEQDLSDARTVCDALGIELHTVNFAQDYWDNVFSHCLLEFKAGRTPNPDILCNREIKFNVLLEHAKSLGADLLATGHYVRRGDAGDKATLLKGVDANKDQSYFLYAITQQQVAQSLFPIGELIKPDVRKIAHEQGFITSTKKDSTGICFIGERRFKTFLSEFILAQPGDMETEDGKVIAKHDGIMFYTIGQRKGLNIGGIKDANEDAWYVLDKDINRNVLIIGQGHNHPRLFKSELMCDQLTWISGTLPDLSKTYRAKTRYRQADQACTIEVIPVIPDPDPETSQNSRLKVTFENPQRAITPGQSVVLYDGELCLGGGIIQ